MMQFVQTFEELQEIIKDHEINDVQKYIVYTTTKFFRDPEVNINENTRLYWDNDIPYFHLGKRCYLCHFGKDLNVRQKEKYAERRDRKAIENNIFTKRYKKILGSKKMNCPAAIYVKKVFRLPQYQVADPNSKVEKAKVARWVKKRIATGEILPGDDGYMFRLPSVHDHQNHTSRASESIIEPIDDKVKDFVFNLVAAGKRKLAIISELLENYVQNELMILDKSERQFYPNLKTLRKTVSQAKSELRQGKLDQENVITLINSLNSLECRVYFRLYSDPQMLCDDENNDYIPSPTDSQLLFVYQNKHMEALYRRYGNTIILDAAYKNLRYYDLPLYFIVVQTNVSYQIVCVIVTQFISTDLLTEGLRQFKDWAPDFVPKCAMVGVAGEEIMSIVNVFPDIDIFVCPYYREQAWNRWFIQKKKSRIPRNDFFKKMRCIANSISPEDASKAIADLKSWSSYANSPLQKYFESIWEPEAKRWVIAYKPRDIILTTHTGIEKLYDELKYQELESCKSCALSEILHIIINTILPKQYEEYLNENIQISQRRYSDEESLPKFLHYRPKWFISHVQKRLNEISHMEVESVIEYESCKFRVPSGKSTFNVNINEQLQQCTCVCKDFFLHGLICKHILMVGFKFSFWNLHNQSWILDNPIFRLDECAFNDTDSAQVIQISDTTDLEGLQTLMEVSSTCPFEPLATITDEKTTELNKTNLINDCNDTIRSLQSLMWCMNEESLSQLSESLKNTFEICSSQVSLGQIEVQQISVPVTHVSSI